MKIKKTLSTLVLSLVFLLGTSIMVFASPNDDVIQALKDANLPKSYIVQAENYLKNVTLTAEQTTAIKAEITKADNIMEAAGVKDASKLSSSQLQSVIQSVKDAGAVIGLNMTIEKNSNGSVYVLAKDSTNKIVAEFTSTDVKQTGANNSMLFAGLAFVVLAAGSFTLLRRKASASI